ncbi:hypothetical protein BD770DRAFT_463040 [Pilaira anomala]|nr:hypothetical protein BD770DRAFT_463040 [Pilaira anomala]
MNELFNFYGFTTAQGKWLDYLGKQKAKEAAVNILLNGGKKYNKRKRKKKKTANNKRRRRNNRRRRMDNPNRPQQNAIISIDNTIKSKLLRRGKFKLGNKTKMPIVIFGDGMFNKDAVRFKGHHHGVISIIYKNLTRERYVISGRQKETQLLDPILKFFVVPTAALYYGTETLMLPKICGIFVFFQSGLALEGPTYLRENQEQNNNFFLKKQFIPPLRMWCAAMHLMDLHCKL